MIDNGRAELARRLGRIFISRRLDDGAQVDVPDETLLHFADEILAADYSDPKWGPRRGDGGPVMRLVTAE